jgi:hypothetical protein
LAKVPGLILASRVTLATVYYLVLLPFVSVVVMAEVTPRVAEVTPRVAEVTPPDGTQLIRLKMNQIQLSNVNITN